MVEIEITNYESIAHTKFVIDGFTTLIGRNYLGKSSVLRAINAALTNKDGTNFISWGKTFCEVHIKFPDLDILWHKEEGNNFYNINGKEYTKIGRGDPPQEILDAGFRPIQVGDQKINLNYAVQFFPLFLVDKRDSKSADILTSVYGLDRIYKAIDLCNKEQRANSDMLRLREKDLTIVDKGLEKFKPFPDIASKIPGLKSKRKELGEKEAEIAKISQWSVLLRDLAQHTKRLRPVSDITLPNTGTISNDLDKYQELVQYDNDMKKLMSYLRRIKPVHDINIPEKSISDIKVLFSEYQRIVVWSNNYNKLSTEIERLEKVNLIQLPTASVDVEDIPRIKKWYEKMVQYSTEVKKDNTDIAKLTSEIEEVEKEINSFDICPLCGAKRG